MVSVFIFVSTERVTDPSPAQSYFNPHQRPELHQSLITPHLGPPDNITILITIVITLLLATGRALASITYLTHPIKCFTNTNNISYIYRPYMLSGTSFFLLVLLVQRKSLFFKPMHLKMRLVLTKLLKV